MANVQNAEIGRTLLIRLDPGEDLLGGLREAVTASGVRQGVFVTGVGSLTSYHLHVVETTNLPPGNVFWKESGPFDIVAVTGAVLGGRVHAHLTVSNDERVMGGHLEPGCNVLTFAFITLLEMHGDDISAWDTPGPLALTQ
ncbi:MAG TPA: PPC domain-containing DNA-binding protein [Thermomicrobiales bacterium]|nr:PPC domain-containing DNA-binding protein [Thermomicrobiales bacterium]